jgi:anti-anti-sigma factor
MPTSHLTTAVRHADDTVAVLELAGDVTAAAEPALMAAWLEAGERGPRGIVLDLRRLEFLNSGGIGLLVTLLVRARRARQEVTAFGLSDHYRHLLAVARVDTAIGLYDDEASAVAAARDAVTAQ